MTNGNRLTAEQVLRNPEALNAPTNVEVLLLTQPEPGSFDAYMLNPTGNLEQDFVDVVAGFVASESDSTLVDHHPGRKPDDHEVAVSNLDELPELVPLTGQLGTLDLPLFDPDSDAAKDLQFYVASLRIDGGQTVHLLRSMTIRKRLKRSNKLAVIFTGAAFDTLESDPLLFDPAFDAMIVDETILLFRLRDFDRALGVLEQTRAAARDTLTSITANLRIRNFDELEEAATSDINMIAKLRSVARRMDDDPAYAQAMTMEKIAPFARDRPDLKDILEGPEGEEEFVFHRDPQRRWRILKLLDDDYLHSEVTDLDYEANSKNPVN